MSNIVSPFVNIKSLTLSFFRFTRAPPVPSNFFSFKQIISVRFIIFLWNFLKRTLLLKPHKIILVIGDAHIYECHTEAVKKQIERTPTEFCQLRIKEREDGSEIVNPEDFRMDDFELVGYKSQGRIKAKMVVWLI